MVGKPEASFFQLALADMEVEAGQAVMVGDDIRDDVGGAQAAGVGECQMGQTCLSATAMTASVPLR